MRQTLEGIRVLDLAPLLPGSLCTQMLADLGAEIIKIESPNGGDNFRTAPPLVGTTGSFFHIVNRNKKGMKLDLKHPRGREVFLRMARESDVIIENFRPGTMQQMGLGYDDLKKINEGIIYCSLTGFGQDGPYSQLPAHDINFLGLSGILDLIGEKNGNPAVPAVQIAGAGGSLQAVVGILAALLRREKTGKGQHLDVAILDGLTPFLGLVMSQYLADGRLPRRGGTLVGGGYAFYNVYETKDGRHITLGSVEKKYWVTLCTLIARPDLVEEQFAPPPRQDEIIEELRAIFRRKTKREWMDLLEGAGICFAPVNTLEEALQDPHLRHRDLWFKAKHPVDGEIPQQAFPIKFSEDQPGWRSHPPVHGEHTLEVLKEMGFNEEEIGSLKSQGII
jgi:crotonobetainyl-CoA:carnitine CoA-transferase CaiB-like acyl-CoA transferase